MKNAGPQKSETGACLNAGSISKSAPAVTGQCGFVLSVIQRYPGIKSLAITADMAVPECAARVHDLRAAGWNIITTIHPAIEFRGQIRRNVASYSLGEPPWPRPGFLDSAIESPKQAQLDLGVDGVLA